MEDLDKLTATGLPVFDLNTENLERKDWSKTCLGPRESWPFALHCLVNSCLLPIPHCVAIFWGNDLAIVHNLAWGKATGDLDGQGTEAVDCYSGEALSSLKTAARGRTVKVDCKFFLRHADDADMDATILLTPVLDEKGSRQGVLAQLLHQSTIPNYMVSGIDSIVKKNNVRQLKGSGAQQQDDKGAERKPGDQADSKQTQLFRRFADLLPNGLAILDSRAEAVFVNDSFFNLTTNRKSKEFRAWPESIDPRDYERIMSEYRKAFSSRKELRVEFRCANEDHTEDGWRLFLLRPLSDDAEAGFICAVVDITEIKHAQIAQEKAATEAQERKDQQERFIDMVSHEIRNPLSAVLHLAEEIKEIAGKVQAAKSVQDKQAAEILESADTILLCVSHQNTLVDDILSFSKLDSMMLSLVPREVTPKWEFATSLKVFNSEFRAKNIKFHYAMDVSYDEQGVNVVIADLNRMKQVLVNLITNAIKFTAKKQGERQITVSMGATVERPTSYPPNVVFFSSSNDSFRIDSTRTSEWGSGSTMYIMVAVKDTGIGIGGEDQKKLFERFRQATPKTHESYGGSGLGLFISRKLCQLHGGDIGVSSSDGQGSTFGFFFKVRRTDSTKEGGRPSFGSRHASETTELPRRSQTPRPDIHQGKSKDLPDRQKRPEMNTKISSREGVDPEASNMNESLNDPPTELRGEAHPEANTDYRYCETANIAKQVDDRPSDLPSHIKGAVVLKDGETEHQAEISYDLAHQQSRRKSNATRSTLLLVEDNLINQKVLRRQLQSRGFEVHVASNGQEAVDAVEERGRAAQQDKTAPDHFDCILMDQEMPIKDGNAASVEIRELQQDGKAGRSPILGVSANVREAQMKSMMDAGMDAVISKPFKVRHLNMRVNEGLLTHAGG
ncbi:two component histidine kinase 1 [Lophiostoma macrostomum CBS 122681]|uniref:Two component histidine kinase 1 n=1 Tax=Lophiostoma macrostomum CBS 122681 TaxID=1314788 RepID=A0A6A6SX95_9PLEO|nr:two component histidine kinase 1 [Lophiostoma macrostomum CBS 122681]